MAAWQNDYLQGETSDWEDHWEYPESNWEVQPRQTDIYISDHIWYWLFTMYERDSLH